jgi:hypothetical protein
MSKIFFVINKYDLAGDLDKSAAVALYMEAIIRLTKLKPGDISKETDAIHQ